MQVAKILNNNQVICLDDNGKECIAVGKGLGFGVSVGDNIVTDKIEKCFSIIDEETQTKFRRLVTEIPLEHISLADEIISYVKCSLGKSVSDNIYVSLTDHLSFAIERCKKGHILSNPLLWETKRFYYHEYKLGMIALDMVFHKTGIRLPEDEAAFIALHIVNAEAGGTFDETVKVTHLIQDVLNIIKYHFNIIFNDQGLDYNRFLTHLRFFMQRLKENKTYASKDSAFYQVLRSEYPNEYHCAEKIKSYIFNGYQHEMTEEETMYLVVHINRLIKSDS
ncbi:TPA: PRD domain-containing protein [Klebsiella pneumoniae]|nr:PRD domain-containing protein [Klebsiella pneumoniae]